MGTRNAKYTWVLGDDDHVVSGSLRYIIDILLSQKNDLGLLIVYGKEYSIHADILKQQVYNSYYDFAIKAVSTQPHLLIAHTLISCNIFKSDIFTESESLYTINSLYHRYSHSTGFPHMRGLVSSLLRSKCSVIVCDKDVLDTNKRVNDVDFGEEIFGIDYFYYLWLLSEIGIRVEKVPHYKSMWWLFSDKKPVSLDEFKSLILFHVPIEIKQKIKYLIKKCNSI